METNSRCIEHEFPATCPNNETLESLKVQVQRILQSEVEAFHKEIPVPCLEAVCSKKSRSEPKEYSLYHGSGSYLVLYYRLYRYYKHIGKVAEQEQYK